MILEVDEPFIVRQVKGLVVGGKEDGPPMQDVTVEVPGPNGQDRIVGTRTDKRGHFKIIRLRPVTYDFKTTPNGFKSYTSRTVISSKAKTKSEIRHVLHPG